MSLLQACGGGSSGTGESTSRGLLVNNACQPVANLALENLGIASEESTSSSDGSFTLAPDAASNIEIVVGGQNETIAASEPICLVVKIEEQVVTDLISLPSESLESCTIEDVSQEYPELSSSFCLDLELPTK
jgi:hypothetical protein